MEELERLKVDLAGGIHTSDTIAKRYGFIDKLQLGSYLRDHPWVASEVIRRKTLLESDQGTPERVVLKSQVAYEELIPSLAAIAVDPRVPPKERIDAAKELRQSGNLGTSRDGKGGGAGTQFSLTINMPGRSEQILATTVVDQAPLPPPEEDEQ